VRSIDSIGGCLSRIKTRRAKGPAGIVLAAVFRFVAHPLIVGVTLSVLATVCSFAAEPKRVLVVHSFGSAAPPFTVHSMAFENALVSKMGERVDLDEVSLDMARYSDPDMQEALVDYLQKRKAKWQPDLVVPIGSPAGIFMAKYRDRLFTETPILYTSLDRRLLPEGALAKNAAYLGQIFDMQGLIEDMLQVAPDTKNITVIVGATPLEQYWKEVFRKTIAPLTDRIHVIYFDNLSFDEMLQRATRLPPHSYIFMLLLLRDAAGVTHNADEALQQLHAVANAPINSIFDHQLGLGIVGGRLYQSERVGKEAAEIAIRILHGEPASSFEPRLVERLTPRYDWRELRRWKVDGKHLPSGSTILFRAPTAWEQYRGWIISGFALFVVETLLIAALLANLVKRRRAERSLTESEARFRKMADAAPAMIWMSGPDKLCTFFNKAWLDFTGRKMEEELGDRWSEGVHPDDLNKCVATYTCAFDARQPFAMQYRLHRHDGEYRYINDQGVPRYDQKGKFIGYVGACVDISDLLQKEQELHKSEERVTLAAEAAHLGVWEWDITTNKIWMSDQARKLFQFEPEAEITHSMLTDRVHPEDRAMRDEAIRHAIATRGEYEVEYRAQLPDGSVRWIAGRGRCHEDSDGRCTRLLGVSADVTERKQAEELFRLATEASPSGILLVDQTARIVLVNAHIEVLFGYQRDELIGNKVEMLVPGGFAAAPGARADRALVGRGKDGNEFPIEISMKSIRTAQGTLFLASVTDISARKRVEEEAQRRRDEISRLERIGLLGEMTASIAHEINQPLSGIIINAGTALRLMMRPNADLEELRDILVDVLADAHRAHRVIRNIRETITKGTAVRQRLSINDVIAGVMHMVQPDAAVHSCELHASLAKELPIVEADPEQIQQVLINLLANAFDAMEKMPSSRRSVEVTTGSREGAVRVSVRDHGAGIAENAREHLFDQFFSTKSQGVGMGLAIVRSIIEAHSGTITVEDTDGDGAQFTFTLPATDGSAK
jgi:PAS domain S-box-containing protein